MPDVRINNIDCYYEIHGKGSPIVLIAGLASDSQSWRPVLGGLAKNFKAIIFDNRGIGRTEYPEESFQISTLAHDTVCLLDSLGIEKAGIIGHSMGGYIAQEIAIEYPERVDKLILASSCAVTSEKNKIRFAGLLKILEGRGENELFIREFFNLIFTPGYLSNKENLESAVRSAVNYPFPVTALGFKLQLEALRSFNSLDRLQKIRSEALLISGKEDIVVTMEEAQLLAEKIPFSKALCLDHAAHSFQAEQPGLFIGAVEKFLL